MKLGTNDIGSVYLGTNAVQKVYLGTNEVWSSYAYLLDDYSGAAAAYSLRLLRTAYTGSAIRVRRASDNTEQDIGFVNNVLDTSTLTSFCSGTNGFVKTWYDQSGNGRDATQTTASSQPQIVSSGSVITENGKPSVQFDGSDDYFQTGTISFVFPQNVAIVSTTVNINNNYLFDTFIQGQNINLNRMGLRYRSEGSGVFAIVDQEGTLKITTNSYTANNQFLNFIQYDNPSTQLYTNNIVNTNTLATTYVDSNRIMNIGTYSGANNVFYQGNMQELIRYPSDQSSNRTGISTNINNFYSIY